MIELFNPYPIALALTKALGVELIDVIAARRDTMLLQVQRKRQVMALKAAIPTPGTPSGYNAAKLMTHEAGMLQLVDELQPKLLVKHGSHEQFGTWLLMRWIRGNTVDQIADRIRAARSTEQMRELFLKILRRYADIHIAGILHGDVQVEHLLFESRQTMPTVLDWALGRRVDQHHPRYRGAHIGYLSPEIASRNLHNHAGIVPYNLSTEMYSIGALLYHCYTGHFPIVWGASDTTLQDKLAATAAQRFRPLPPPRSHADAKLQAVIKSCLVGEPRGRCGSVRQAIALLG